MGGTGEHRRDSIPHRNVLQGTSLQPDGFSLLSFCLCGLIFVPHLHSFLLLFFHRIIFSICGPFLSVKMYCVPQQGTGLLRYHDQVPLLHYRSSLWCLNPGFRSTSGTDSLPMFSYLSSNLLLIPVCQIRVQIEKSSTVKSCLIWFICVTVLSLQKENAQMCLQVLVSETVRCLIPARKANLDLAAQVAWTPVGGWTFCHSYRTIDYLE